MRSDFPSPFPHPSRLIAAGAFLSVVFALASCAAPKQGSPRPGEQNAATRAERQPLTGTISGSAVALEASDASTPVTTDPVVVEITIAAEATTSTLVVAPSTDGESTTTITLAAAVTGLQAGMQFIVPGVTNANPGDYNLVTNVNSTTVTISRSVTIASAATMTFVGYPEVLVKWNQGYHSYDQALATGL